MNNVGFKEMEDDAGARLQRVLCEERFAITGRSSRKLRI